MRWCTKRTFRWLQGAFASQSQCCGISLYARSSYLPEKICSISVNENHAHIHMDSKFNSKRAEQCFEPSTRQVTEAKRLFELLGPKSVLQGSALKPDDSPKLHLPEVILSIFRSCTWIGEWPKGWGDGGFFFKIVATLQSGVGNFLIHGHGRIIVKLKSPQKVTSIGVILANFYPKSYHRK